MGLWTPNDLHSLTMTWHLKNTFPKENLSSNHPCSRAMLVLRSIFKSFFGWESVRSKPIADCMIICMSMTWTMTIWFCHALLKFFSAGRWRRRSIWQWQCFKKGEDCKIAAVRPKKTARTDHWQDANYRWNRHKSGFQMKGDHWNEDRQHSYQEPPLNDCRSKIGSVQNSGGQTLQKILFPIIWGYPRPTNSGKWIFIGGPS